MPNNKPSKFLFLGFLWKLHLYQLQTFFTWLGLVPYLTEPAIWSTLGFIASLPNGVHVVFDYSNPSASFSPKMRIVHEGRAAQVAKLGEAFITYFETENAAAN
jgi:O-methyltransferase involved in polyketide biosynthesis